MKDYIVYIKMSELGETKIKAESKEKAQELVRKYLLEELSLGDTPFTSGWEGFSWNKKKKIEVSDVGLR